MSTEAPTSLVICDWLAKRARDLGYKATIRSLDKGASCHVYTELDGVRYIHLSCFDVQATMRFTAKLDGATDRFHWEYSDPESLEELESRFDQYRIGL